MRLVRHGTPPRLGLLLADRIHDLTALDPALPTSIPRLLAADALHRIAGWKPTGPGLPLADAILHAPIADPGSIICVGLNYAAHAQEQNAPFPERPLLFSKGRNTLCGPRDPIRIPDPECGPDYEVELVVVMGRRSSAVSADQALDHVAGYLVGNDVTARRWQKRDGQWFRAKSCDTFLPCGPWFTTREEVADWRDLELTTTINGEVLQQDVAGGMIHGLPDLIADITRTITLEPGDLILTGTPAGVGCYRTPRRWLTPGEVVECRISGPGVDLGCLANPVELR